MRSVNKSSGSPWEPWSGCSSLSSYGSILRGLAPFLGYIYLTGLLVFVAAVSVAILRYRLYDIDLVISRALVYGGLAASITMVYVGLVAGIGTLAHQASEPDLLLPLVATALVAVIFQPARERLQRLANRLVYGHRASPYEVLADFSNRIAGALSVDEVLPRVAAAAAHGVRASRSRVRVYVPDGQDRAVAWPTGALDEHFERTVPVFHQGTPVGEIAVAKSARDPLTAAEVNLLEDLAAQAGSAFKNVRLDIELQARLTNSRHRVNGSWPRRMRSGVGSSGISTMARSSSSSPSR